MPHWLVTHFWCRFRHQNKLSSIFFNFEEIYISSRKCFITSTTGTGDVFKEFFFEGKGFKRVSFLGGVNEVKRLTGSLPPAPDKDGPDVAFQHPSGRGGCSVAEDLADIVLTLYSEDPSSNPEEKKQFFCKILNKKNKNTEKEACRWHQ